MIFWQKIPVLNIFPVTQNVNIRWEINFYDKNTCQAKGIWEKN